MKEKVIPLVSFNETRNGQCSGQYEVSHSASGDLIFAGYRIGGVVRIVDAKTEEVVGFYDAANCDERTACRIIASYIAHDDKMLKALGIETLTERVKRLLGPVDDIRGYAPSPELAQAITALVYKARMHDEHCPEDDLSWDDRRFGRKHRAVLEAMHWLGFHGDSMFLFMMGVAK